MFVGTLGSGAGIDAGAVYVESWGKVLTTFNGILKGARRKMKSV
jgi:hypothetical protein